MKRRELLTKVTAALCINLTLKGTYAFLYILDI